ncbi:MAG: glycosyltransferase [Pedobacter sp.]|nr:MAG: glycosyltransferase [Pedobacter sp.]
MILIFTTHPIQYQTPLWKKIAESKIDIEVIFLTKHGLELSYDAEFGTSFKWNLNLLDGYSYSFAKVNENADVNSFYNLRLKQSLKSIIADRHVEAIWIQGWQALAYWQIAIQARILNIPIWLRGETNNLKPKYFSKEIVKYLPFKLFFGSISKFLYIGKANRNFYLERGISQENLIFAPYCIDVDRFQEKLIKAPETKISARKKWNIPEDSFCFIFSGKFIEKKMPMIILEASKKIPHHKIHLLFVGDGELRNNLIKSANVAYAPDHFAIEDRDAITQSVSVSFTGFINQDEISDAYIASDCLLLPSDYGETWGLVVNEAYAHGIPAIVSDHCGCYPDLVEPFHQPLIFEYNNVSDLSRAMLFALENHKNLTSHLTQVNSTYNYDTTVKNISNLLNSTPTI